MADQVELAIHSTVHATPDSCANLARVMGKSHQVFINKANFNCDTHHFTNPEILAIQLHTGNNSIHRAMGMVLGEFSFSAPKGKVTDVMAALMISIVEQGDVTKTVTESLADGVITPRERAEIFAQIDEAIAGLVGLKSTLKGGLK